jgi:hypothetical protein
MVGGGVELAGSASAWGIEACSVQRAVWVCVCVWVHGVHTSFWAVNESVGRVAMSGCRCHDVWRSGAGIWPQMGELVHIQAQ